MVAGPCVDGYSTTSWVGRDVAQIEPSKWNQLPTIGPSDALPIIDGLTLWDLWPVQHADGTIARFNGGVTLWMILSASTTCDPNDRHGSARIRLFQRAESKWQDCGNVFADGFSPGSREWAGSAVVDTGLGSLRLFFTAAGRRGEPHTTFEQRLFEVTGSIIFRDGQARIEDWSEPSESFVSDDDTYVLANQAEGGLGTIKAFRDPSFFRDPADGKDYLVFTGSLKKSRSAYNGAIGIACASESGWSLMQPLISADGLNNELERPHLIYRDGLYYIFWSTQSHVFNPEGPVGPTGLYGMVSSSLFGPFKPLNGTGLVVANPVEEPYQTFSWHVLDSLEVASFVDHWGLQGRSPGDYPEQFAGTPAPLFRIALAGEMATLAKAAAQ